MLKVLVVEDEELIRKGIVLALDWAALDCVVVAEASNGEEALEAVERYAPSLIITDLKMPRMDGLEMLRRLRERGSSAYVIILTAYDSFEYAQSALRLGAVDFLLKPFHDGELEQAVTALRRRLEPADDGEERSSLPLLRLKKGDKSKYVLQAMELLRDCRAKVYEVAEQVGYRDITYFSTTFKKWLECPLRNTRTPADKETAA